MHFVRFGLLSQREIQVIVKGLKKIPGPQHTKKLSILPNDLTVDLQTYQLSWVLAEVTVTHSDKKINLLS